MITHKDMGFIQDEDGVWHKPEHICARVGGLKLGYYVTQELADAAIANCERDMVAKIKEAAQDLIAKDEALTVACKEQAQAQTALRELRAKTRKASQAMYDAQNIYRAESEKFKRAFPQYSLENLVANAPENGADS